MDRILRFEINKHLKKISNVPGTRFFVYLSMTKT